LGGPMDRPMDRRVRVLVAAGHNKPFERLLRLVEPLAADGRVELFVQKGYASEAFPDLPGAAFVDKAAFAGYLEWADVVITQGGAGTIYEACRAGHLPIVVPRRAHFAEHVNDHQFHMTSALAAQGLVQLYDEAVDLLSAVLHHRPRLDRAEIAPSPLARAVKVELQKPGSRRILGRGMLAMTRDLFSRLRRAPH
jgi:UDP-N-acetylglucosamine transferase subunit ALG13